MIPLLSSLLVLLLAALAEWLHAWRVSVVARLAFGPAAAPRNWVRWTPGLRVFGMTAFAWGLATLWMIKVEASAPSGGKGKDETATHLVFVADLSPSMYLVDAGPDGTQTRQARMREVVEGILERVSGNLRFGVVGFYTDALPVVMEARDPELVRNVFNGLPLSYGMPSGQTDLGTAVNVALEKVKDLPPASTRIILCTDGDSIPLKPIAPRPASVKEVMILGIGNPDKGSFIDGHQSRQETDVLRNLAATLLGTYQDVNKTQVATSALGDLVVPAPLPKTGLSLAEWAVLAMTAGSALLALLPLALEQWGADWQVPPTGTIQPARRQEGPASGRPEGSREHAKAGAR